MRKLLFGIALTMPIAFMSPAATALPGGHAMIDGSLVKADLIEVKGGTGAGMAGAAGTAIARLVGVAAGRSAGAGVAARPVIGRRAGAKTGQPVRRAE
jgi:hypothetical protein